jgi:glycerophosphoryl diester phosphodiesterase
MLTISHITRLVISALALIVIVMSAGVLVWFMIHEESAERRTSGRQPVQFYRAVAPNLLDDYSSVFGIAHNSGDSLLATRRALEHGADIIEIDVVSFNGRLYAAHDPPVGVVGRRSFRGPSLIRVWEEASEADVIALDLKETSPQFLEMVADFLQRHPERQVIVATPHAESLRVLAERAPDAFRFYSISTQARLDALYDDAELIAIIDGVGIRQTLVTGESAGWLKDQDLMILAWTVNDINRVNDLVGHGVHAITTDNLAILELLGGQERQGDLLSHSARRQEE